MKRRQASLAAILTTVFIDMMGTGIVFLLFVRRTPENESLAAGSAVKLV